MRYTLLENGVDSLKAAYNCIIKIPELREGLEHNIKDAVLSLNHAIEILFKLILREHNEYLIFFDLEKYMSAKEKMINDGKANVLEASPGLKTIAMTDAIKRLEYLCEIQIPAELKATIHYLNKIRNQIMHYEINLTPEEVEELNEKLRICYETAFEFVEHHVDDFDELVTSARFEITEEQYEIEMMEYYAEVMRDQMD